MRIAYIVHSYGHFETAKEMIKEFFTVTDWMNALSNLGMELYVFYRFNQDDFFVHKGIEYHFIKDQLPNLLKPWHRANYFNMTVSEQLKKKNIQLIHTHNPYSSLVHANLKKHCTQIPVLIQDHAGLLNLKYALYHRLFLRNIEAFLFAAKGQESIWLQKKIFTKQQVYFVMENSSNFNFLNQDVSRKKTGMKGNPVFLWVGNLNKNKNPFTVLKAFEKYLSINAEAQLYMIYRFNDLEKELKSKIESSPLLNSHVHLLGAKKRADLEVYYNSADYFISASYKEGSGYALIEAMSCGVIPIVTKIPSFKTLTNSGAIGHLFAPESSDELFNILKELPKTDLEKNRKIIHSYFKEKFSFEAIAHQMKIIYSNLANH